MKTLAPHIFQRIEQNPRFSDIQESEPSGLSQLLEKFTRARRELLAPLPPEAVRARLRNDSRYLRNTVREIDGLWEMEMYVRYLMEGGTPATLQ